jgi:hypothetical protein
LAEIIDGGTLHFQRNIGYWTLDFDDGKEIYKKERV